MMLGKVVRKMVGVVEVVVACDHTWSLVALHMRG